MLRTLPQFVGLPAIILLFYAGRLLAQSDVSSPDREHSGSQTLLVVLRNGQVLEGRVTSAGERVLVALPGREISLRASEIDIVAESLEVAYRAKLSKTRPTDLNSRLDLAAWCVRHKLWNEAREELSAAEQTNEFSPRLISLQRRLDKEVANQATSPPPLPEPSTRAATRPSRDGVNQAGVSWPAVEPKTPSVKKPAQQIQVVRHDVARTVRAAAPSPATLERFVNGLPSGAVEQFTSSLHPMITRGCATAGCHAPGNATEFTLLRLPYGRAAHRRLTQRNLYNTVQLVDFDNPEESRLLKIAIQPHGPLPAGVFGDARSPKYQELVAWISGLTGVPLNQSNAVYEAAIANPAWDREQNAAGPLDPTEQPLDGGPASDGLQPNRPAGIKIR